MCPTARNTLHISRKCLKCSLTHCHLLLVLLLASYPSPTTTTSSLSTMCSMASSDLNDSTWARFVRSAVFMPVDAEHAKTAAITQANELVEIINYFKDRYVLNTFHESSSESHDQLYSDLHFHWLLPSSDPILNNNNEAGTMQLISSQQKNVSSLLSSAYDAFQRVSVALELVTRDLRQSDEDFVGKYGRFWQLAERTANRAVEAIYVAMMAHGITDHSQDLLKRNLVPRRLRCVRMQSRRDVRDWVVLRDSLKIAQHYRRVFQAVL